MDCPNAPRDSAEKEMVVTLDFSDKVREILNRVYVEGYSETPSLEAVNQALTAITTLHESVVGRLNGDTLVLNQARVDALKERDALHLTIKELVGALEKTGTNFAKVAESIGGILINKELDLEKLRDVMMAVLKNNVSVLDEAREALAKVKENVE